MKRIENPTPDMVHVGNDEIKFGGMNPVVVDLILSPLSENVIDAWRRVFGRLVLNKNPELTTKVAERTKQKVAAGITDDEVYYTVARNGKSARLDFYV